MSTNVFSGARAVFKVGAQKVAFASGCDGTEEVMYEAVDVLDNLEVAEYVPVGYRVTFNAAIFRTVKGVSGAKTVPDGQRWGSVKEMGLMPKNGIDLKNIMTSGAMTATVEDSLTKKIVSQIEEVKCATNNWSITARGIVGQNLTFNAIRAKDESELA